MIPLFLIWAMEVFVVIQKIEEVLYILAFLKFNFISFLYLPNDLLIDFRGRGREGERERNINVREISMVASSSCPSGDQTHNLGTCPDWESNWQPFSF